MMITKIIIFLLYEKDSEFYCYKGYSYSNEYLEGKNHEQD